MFNNKLPVVYYILLKIGNKGFQCSFDTVKTFSGVRTLDVYALAVKEPKFRKCRPSKKNNPAIPFTVHSSRKKAKKS